MPSTFPEARVRFTASAFEAFDRRLDSNLPGDELRAVGQTTGEGDAVILLRAFASRAVDFRFPVDAPEAQDCRVDHVGVVSGDEV